MPEMFELPKRYETKIYQEDDWIVLEQELGSEGTQRIVIHKFDLQTVVDALCGFAGIGGSKP